MSYTAYEIWVDHLEGDIDDFIKSLVDHANEQSRVKLMHYLLNTIAFNTDSNIYEYMLEISSFHNNEDEEACIIVKRNGCTEIFGSIPKGMKVISSSGKDIDSYEGL